MTGSYQLLDANVLIRFLADDHPQHSPKARRLIARAASGEISLWLTDLCVAEVVWTIAGKAGLVPLDCHTVQKLALVA